MNVKSSVRIFSDFTLYGIGAGVFAIIGHTLGWVEFTEIVNVSIVGGTTFIK